MTGITRAASGEYVPMDYIAAIVNDSVITYHEVERYTAQALDLLKRTYQYQPETLRERANQTLQDGLEQLLEKQLILDEFKTLGGRLPDTVIEDEIKERIRKNFVDRATLTRQLKAQGVTQEVFRKQIHDEIVLEYMRRKNVSSAVIISPQKIEEYYKANLADFQVSDQVKLRMIVLNKSSGSTIDDLRHLGLEIIRKMDEGASFAEMAGGAILVAVLAIFLEFTFAWLGRIIVSPGLRRVASKDSSPLATAVLEPAT